MSHRPIDERRRWHLCLLLIPFLWQIGGANWANGVTMTIASLPMPMVWQMAGIIVTTIVLAIVYWIDERRAGGQEE
jgi:uncharacterized membrane protein